MTPSAITADGLVVKQQAVDHIEGTAIYKDRPTHPGTAAARATAPMLVGAASILALHPAALEREVLDREGAGAGDEEQTLVAAAGAVLGNPQ